MAMRGLSVLAVVPARGGSKGVPRKNLQAVGGQSLIARAAAVVRALPWLDAALISTDDPDIAEEGRRHGLQAPFLRPAELSGDTAGAAETWRHAWLEAERQHGRRFDLSVWLQPTSPMREPDEVTRTVTAMLDGNHAAAATVSRVPGHHTPEKTFTIDPNGVMRFYLPEGARHTSRQSIPPYYTRNGHCYATRRATLVDRLHIVEEDCCAVVIDRFIVNIDDPIEIELAEWAMAREARLRGT
ncbi:acylneuraminate cytidylyltransferase family protein [Desertibaculum subflavum]|uniref:acylneuraminate cytidylyltransferase family protein n=1 Tax=Desertibaculum subflavum TaxID=2268458 RepID=UPI000E669D35